MKRKSNPRSQGILTTPDELLYDVSRFMSMVDKKIKVEINDDYDVPAVIVTFPKGSEYVIGCDTDKKILDKYSMKPKCFFASRGETHYSNSYYEPDEFDWVDIADDLDDVASACVKVAMDYEKRKLDYFADFLESVYFDFVSED